MKVLLVNGSPNRKGCTYTALCEVEKSLNEGGVETEHFWIGNRPIGGCIACRKCAQQGACVFDNDPVNKFVALAAHTDGFVFGSPVYYASANGSLTAFMDRVFFSEACSKGCVTFRLKPAAAIVSARRSGTTTAMDQLNKFFSISEMPIISSGYWNAVHGNTPVEVEQDKEGLWTMRQLGRNMAFFLRCKEMALAAGLSQPEKEKKITTNFIR